MKELCIKDICIKDSSSLKQKDLKESGKYPVYGASGIAGYLDTYQQEVPYIAIVKDGSGIGRVSFQEAKSSLIGTMQYILPKPGYDIRYIGYCLQSLDLSKYKQGAAIPHIYFRDYGERKVNVTDNFSEQQQIVERLDAAFAHIDELKAKAEKQLNEARQLFQAELTESMKPKEGWEEKKLGEVCEIIGGGTPAKNNSSYYNGTIPWATVRDMNCDILCSTEFSISETGLKNSSSHLIQKGEIIIATRVGLGKVCKLAQDTAINQDLKAIVPKKENIIRDFIYYFFKNDAQKLIDNGVGATVKGVKIKFVEELSFPLPQKEVQQRIVAHLDALSENVRKYEEIQRKTLAECDALKQAILREVFE